MARHIFVVGTAHRDLYDLLVTRFEDDRNVTVVLDRRTSGHGIAPSTSPSRQGHHPLVLDRRTRPAVDEELKSRSHAIVTIPDWLV
jgi:hypothetical protein